MSPFAQCPVQFSTITQPQTRPATGNHVNLTFDRPIHVFTVQDLAVRAKDLIALLDAVSSAINTIRAANNGMSAITKLVQSAQALVSRARQTPDTTVRATLASQFDALPPQIDQLAADVSFNGVNRLTSSNLTTAMDENGAPQILVKAFKDTAVGDFAIATATNSWATEADVMTAGDNLKQALITLRSQAQILSSILSTIQIRQNFAKAMIDTLHSCADNLTIVDSKKEGANLIALQTRQLSTTAPSLEAHADRSVLRLFR